MHRLRAAVGLTLVFVLASIVNAQAVTVVPIKTTKLFEIQPESTTLSGHHLFAWTRTVSSNSRGRGWNVVVSVGGGSGRQISRKGSFSWPNGFDDIGRLIFQQSFITNQSDSDLYMWSSGHVTRLPAALNNRRWQYGGDRWGDWLVYGENQFRTKSSPWTIFSYNFSTHTKQVLASSTDGCACIDPGNVVGTLASYRLARHIAVEQLATTPTVIGTTSPPTGFSDDYPFLTDPTPAQANSGDETLFWVRTKTGPCGHGVQILQAPLDDLNASTVIDSFQTGAVDSLSVDDSTGMRNLYFGRSTCAKAPRGDIFEIANV